MNSYSFTNQNYFNLVVGTKFSTTLSTTIFNIRSAINMNVYDDNN